MKGKVFQLGGSSLVKGRVFHLGTVQILRPIKMERDRGEGPAG